MKKHKYYQNRIKELFLEKEESKLVENRYKTIRYATYEEYKDIMDLISKDRMIDFIKDIVYLDRKLRDMTEDVQVEQKKILSQQWQVDNGYIGNLKLKI